MKTRLLNPWLLALLVFLSGVGLYYRSTQLPRYTDASARAQLDASAASSNMSDAFKESYWTQLDALSTNKIFFEDLGTGLAIVAVILFAFLAWYRVKTFADFKKIQSPRKLFLFILSNLAWLSVAPGSIWYYEFRFQRGDYPWFSDTIIIPQMAVLPFVAIGLIVMNIFIWLYSTHSKLPAPVFVKINFRDKTEVTAEIFWLILLVLNCYFFYWFVVDGDHFSIPVNMFFTYLLLVLRAGRLKFLRETVEETAT